MRPAALTAALALLCGCSLLADAPDPDAGVSVTAVSFANDDTPLAGDVLLPAGADNVPGVAIVHGSGPATRTQGWARAFAEALVARGIAVLIPDKRGSGDSGGDWTTAGFDVLAGDAIAATGVLRATPSVEPRAVGVVGLSQGGHIVPLAAARDPNLAFVINASGSAVPMMQQVMDEVSQLAERKGFTPEQVAAVDRIHELMIRFAMTGEGWEDYVAARAAALDTAMAGHGVIEPFTVDPGHWVWDFAKVLGNFDPMPHWKALKVPALFLYGSEDTQIRVGASVARLERELAGSGVDWTVLVYGRTGHGLREPHDGGHALRRDMLDAMQAFILRATAATTR